MEAPSVANLSHALPAADSAEPHYALFLVLAYLRLPELLAFRQVCRAFRDQIAADEALWRHITVEPPLSARLRDDILLRITSFARGNLKSLALMRCWRVTDEGLLCVVERNPWISKTPSSSSRRCLGWDFRPFGESEDISERQKSQCLGRDAKLCILSCTDLTADGVVRVVKRLDELNGHLECLRLNGLCNIDRKHLNVLKSLLYRNFKQETSHSFFYNYWRLLPLNCYDGHPIDVDICPKCQNVRMVFDCSRKEDCRTMRRWRRQCRGCFFCIPRCEECGGCVDKEEELEEETAYSHLLCAACWLLLPKCSSCNRPCCRRDMKAQALSSAGFVCEQCRDSFAL